MENTRGSFVQSRFLKKLFQRFGHVLDVFIPRKFDDSGSNFGFVRFPSLREAENAAFMFDGAWVVDRRIQVNIVKFRCRSTYWRKKKSKEDSRSVIFHPKEGDVRSSFWKYNRVTTGTMSAVNQSRGDLRGSRKLTLEVLKGDEDKSLAEDLKERSEDECMVFGIDKKALTEKKLVNLIFSTKQRGKKENIFAAEVGSMLFEFRVDEMEN
ncbi:hypothetical protein GQ457_02G018470 [Hibiscus cannabinus]